MSPGIYFPPSLPSAFFFVDHVAHAAVSYLILPFFNSLSEMIMTFSQESQQNSKIDSDYLGLSQGLTHEPVTESKKFEQSNIILESYAQPWSQGDSVSLTYIKGLSMMSAAGE